MVTVVKLSLFNTISSAVLSLSMAIYIHGTSETLHIYYLNLEFHSIAF